MKENEYKNINTKEFFDEATKGYNRMIKRLEEERRENYNTITNPNNKSTEEDNIDKGLIEMYNEKWGRNLDDKEFEEFQKELKDFEDYKKRHSAESNAKAYAEGAYDALNWNKEQRELDEQKIDHPERYGGANNPFECIKVLEGWRGKNAVMEFCLCNAIKYLCRIGKKADDNHEIDKAIWYLNYYKKLNQEEK